MQYKNSFGQKQLQTTRALGSEDKRSRDHDHDPFLTIEARSAIIFYRGIELEIAIVFLPKISILKFRSFSKGLTNLVDNKALIILCESSTFPKILGLFPNMVIEAKIITY